MDLRDVFCAQCKVVTGVKISTFFEQNGEGEGRDEAVDQEMD